MDIRKEESSLAQAQTQIDTVLEKGITSLTFRVSSSGKDGNPEDLNAIVSGYLKENLKTVALTAIKWHAKVLEEHILAEAGHVQRRAQEILARKKNGSAPSKPHILVRVLFVYPYRAARWTYSLVRNRF